MTVASTCPICRTGSTTLVAGSYACIFRTSLIWLSGRRTSSSATIVGLFTSPATSVAASGRRASVATATVAVPGLVITRFLDQKTEKEGITLWREKNRGK